jgi:acyl-CoA thioester hydrolase
VRFPVHPRYADYDSKGHLHHAAYLHHFEAARTALWTEVLGEDPDVPFVVAAAAVRYLAPARLGEALDVDVERGEVRTKAWVWRYRVTARAGGRAVAEGETTQVMFDYAAGTSVPIPPALRAKLAGGAGA